MIIQAAPVPDRPEGRHHFSIYCKIGKLYLLETDKKAKIIVTIRTRMRYIG
jgi:hypothetical protein